MVASRLVFVNAVILYSLAYDIADVMDDDYLVTALSAQTSSWLSDGG